MTPTGHFAQFNYKLKSLYIMAGQQIDSIHFNIQTLKRITNRRLCLNMKNNRGQSVEQPINCFFRIFFFNYFSLFKSNRFFFLFSLHKLRRRTFIRGYLVSTFASQHRKKTSNIKVHLAFMMTRPGHT